MALPEGSKWYMRRADESVPMNTAELEVTFPELPGQVFNGTVEAVVAQVAEVNPGLLPNETSAALDRRGLDKRQGVCNSCKQLLTLVGGKDNQADFYSVLVARLQLGKAEGW